jgi:hypothetical protein
MLSRQRPFKKMMNQYNTNLLYARYPRLYQGRLNGIEQSGMPWGFCCGDGWFELIDRLSAAIEKECVHFLESGWAEKSLPIATQVKERSGFLCFRVGCFPPPDGIQSLIEQARIESESICQECGDHRKSISCQCFNAGMSIVP